MGCKNFFTRLLGSITTTFAGSKSTRRGNWKNNEVSTSSKCHLSPRDETFVRTMLDALDSHKLDMSSGQDIHVKMMFDDNGQMTSCRLEPFRCYGPAMSAASPILSVESDTTAVSSNASTLAPYCVVPRSLSPYSVIAPNVAVGRVLKASDFKPIKRLGKGGQGTVLLVHDIVTHLQLSLKVIKKREVLLRYYPDIFEEQYVMKTMAGNAAVLPLLGSFHDDENFYFLTEHMPGGDLLSKMRWPRKLTPQDALYYVAQLILGLGVLHENRILHRDIKHENVLFDANSRMVLADLGFAKAFGRPKTDFPWKASHHWDCDEDNSEGGIENDFTRSKCGTRGFMAPEIYYGPRYSYAADIWAVGVTLYMMLLGRFPFGMSMDQSYPELFRRAKTLPLQFGASGIVSDDAQDLISWMLEKDPHMRPTITKIKAHVYFKDINWQQLGRRDMLVCDDANANLSSCDVTKKFCGSISAGVPYNDGEDPFPWFTWVSPALQGPSVSESGVKATEKHSHEGLMKEGKAAGNNLFKERWKKLR